jgi:hypothetical protein
MTTPTPTGSAAPTASPAAAARPTRPSLLARGRAISLTLWIEIAVALLCFVVLSGAALTRPVSLLEPDDYAYRASIVALTEGHLVLSDAQYQDLADRLRQQDAAAGLGGSQGIAQWTQLSDGGWASEKNPGYPFLVAPFALVGLERLAPLFYGGLGCVALFFGARRWLGAWGGAFAVGLFCSSGAALAFAWRAWMPTFAGAALIAVGAGALLWALLAAGRRPRLRTATGLLGFLALEGAMLVRYTDVIALAVAVVAVLAVWRFVPGRLPRRALVWWLGSAVLAGVLALAWNAFVYGSVTATGYASGVITFGLGAISGNLDSMPALLVETMPACLLALAAVVWMVGRSIWLRRTAPEGEVRPTRAAAHRDLAVGAALAVAWWGTWALYSTYYWTAQMSAGSGAGGAAGPAGADNAIHLIRFFVPALAPIALLGAWALVRMPRWAALTVIAAFFGLGLWSYADMTAADPRGGIMGGMPGGQGGAPGPPPGSDGVGGAPGSGGAMPSGPAPGADGPPLPPPTAP